MYAVARPSGKKSWQTGRERVSVEAALAIQRENVSARLVRLREEAGHPDKPGEPLPQDQAAARAGVTVRQWQRWENGVSLPYARNLSAVADAFGIDVAEFYDGPAGQRPAGTPDPFIRNGVTIEGELAAVLADIIAQLAAQTGVLREIQAEQANLRAMIQQERREREQAERARAANEESTRRLLAAVDVASRALLGGAQPTVEAPEQPTK